MMAFLTVEDLAGSVEVLVFPKDYEKRRDMLIKDEKVFIRGRASVGDEPVGKLICEQIIPFSRCRASCGFSMRTRTRIWRERKNFSTS